MDIASGIIAGTTATALAVVSVDGAKISVELAGTIFVSGCTLVWWLSSKFTKLDDNISSLREDVNEVKAVIKNCPAVKNINCEAED